MAYLSRAKKVLQHFETSQFTLIAHIQFKRSACHIKLAKFAMISKIYSLKTKATSLRLIYEAISN